MRKLFWLLFALPLLGLLPIKSLTGGVPDSPGVQTITLNGVTVGTWTDQPATVARLGPSIVQLDLTYAQQVRFTINVVTAGAAGARVGAQYSPNGSTGWRFFDGATGPTVPIDSVGPKQSPWIDLEAGAKGVVFIAIGGQGGNGVADPAFGLTFLEFQ